MAVEVAVVAVDRDRRAEEADADGSEVEVMSSIRIFAQGPQ